MGNEIYNFTVPSEQGYVSVPRPKDGTFDPALKIGVVESIFFDEVNNDFIYSVRVNERGAQGSPTILCRVIYRFNSLINQEFYNLSDMGPESDSVPVFQSAAGITPGDTVIVAFLNGLKLSGDTGIILGSLSGPRPGKPWVQDPGVRYYSSYLGIDHVIKNSGEYSITFNGPPTNLKELVSISDAPVSKVYNQDIAGTSLRFISDGSFEVSDNKANNAASSIKISKNASLVSITSGPGTSVRVNGSNKSVAIAANTITLDTKNQSSSDKIQLSTSALSVNSTQETIIKSPKVAIGTSEAELLDLIEKLIDALGTIQVITPMGPAQPLKQDLLGSWSSKIEDIKSKINSIKGKIP